MSVMSFCNLVVCSMCPCWCVCVCVLALVLSLPDVCVLYEQAGSAEEKW